MYSYRPAAAPKKDRRDVVHRWQFGVCAGESLQPRCAHKWASLSCEDQCLFPTYADIVTQAEDATKKGLTTAYYAKSPFKAPRAPLHNPPKWWKVHSHKSGNSLYNLYTMTLRMHLRPPLNPSWLARFIIMWVIAALSSGCNGRATPTPPVEPLPTKTPAAQPVASETAVPATNDQLVVWLPAFTGIAGEGSAGSLLTNVFHQFEQSNPSIRLDVQVKADSGTAGLFNFLRSAQEVAPSILPDLVLINTQQLWQIVDLGMVVALAEEELTGDANFFRVANDSVRYRTQIVGIPYTVDIIHLAYDGDAVESPPTSWAEVTEGDQTYLFPAAEGGTTSAALLHYVAAGGTLLEDGSITSPEALERYFNFLVETRAKDVIPATVLDMPGYNAVWRAFAENRADLALVQVLQFYPNATGIKPPSYAAAPTLDGEPLSIADTWAFAILTEDAQRRRLALALIEELLAPEVQGPWSQSVARLPSQPASLALWTQAGGYRDFVQTMLDGAVSPPNGVAFADFARRLHTAQAALIRGDLTVEAAIASMVVVE